MWKKYLGNEGGYALVIAVLAITMITILGLSVLATTTHSKNSVVKEDNNQTAYYIAEAGLNLKKADLQEIEKIYDEFQKEILAEQQNAINANKDVPKMTSAQFIAAFKARVATKLNTVTAKTYYASSDSQCTGKTNCTKVLERENSMATVTTEAVITDTNFTYKINSVGSVNQQTRKIATTLSYALDAKAYKEKVVADSFSKYAIHATGTLNMTDGQIKGNIGFSGNQPNSKTFPFASNSGSLSYTGETTKKEYKACGWWKDDGSCGSDGYMTIADAVTNKDVVFNDPTLPNIPNFPTDKFPNLSESPDTRKIWDDKTPTNPKKTLPSSGELSGNYQLNNNAITTNMSLNIGSNEVNIYMDSFHMDSSSISILGNGTLNIYTNSFKKVDANNINFDNNTVNIYANNSVEFTGSAGISSVKNLTITTKNLNFTSSANFNIQNNLNMYVHNSLKLTNSMKMTTKNWNIYYAGLTLPEFNGGFQNSVNIDSLYSGITINAGIHLGGNIIIRGETPKYGSKPNINVEISGGSETLTPQYFYAPYSDVTLSGSGKVVGALIGKNITMSGGSKVVFKSLASSNTPGSNELEEITDGSAGKITSSFTNKSSGGSIEVD